MQPAKGHGKIWFAGHLIGGTLDCSTPEAKSEHIVEAAWLAREDLDGKTVFPPMLLTDCWNNNERKRVDPRYVGLREMAFY